MAQQVRATELRNGTAELTADVYETAGGEAYVIEVPVPGLRPDELNIEVTIDTVTISTEPRERSQDSGRRYFQREQPTERMSRVFEFPGHAGERHLEGPRAESRCGPAQNR